jgi:hypothetical protein
MGLHAERFCEFRRRLVHYAAFIDLVLQCGD